MCAIGPAMARTCRPAARAGSSGGRLPLSRAVLRLVSTRGLYLPTLRRPGTKAVPTASREVRGGSAAAARAVRRRRTAHLDVPGRRVPRRKNTGGVAADAAAYHSPGWLSGVHPLARTWAHSVHQLRPFRVGRARASASRDRRASPAMPRRRRSVATAAYSARRVDRGDDGEEGISTAATGGSRLARRATSVRRSITGVMRIA
jgi:hypothetical protein